MKNNSSNVSANVQKILDNMESKNKIRLSLKEKMFSNSARKGLKFLNMANKKYNDGIKEYSLRTSASQYISESPNFMEYIRKCIEKDYIDIAKKYFCYASEEFEQAKNKAHNLKEFDLKDKYKACKLSCDNKANSTENNFENFVRQTKQSLKVR